MQSHTSPTLITHARSNAAVKMGAWWTGNGRGTEGGRRTASRDAQRTGAALRWVVQQQVTAAAGKDVVAYLKRNNDRRKVFIHRLLHQYLSPCIDLTFSAVGLFELS